MSGEKRSALVVTLADVRPNHDVRTNIPRAWRTPEASTLVNPRQRFRRIPWLNEDPRTSPNYPPPRRSSILPAMARLSVNLNKVALLRNSRRTGVPDIARFARIALSSGAEGLTV